MSHLVAIVVLCCRSFWDPTVALTRGKKELKRAVGGQPSLLKSSEDGANPQYSQDALDIL